MSKSRKKFAKSENFEEVMSRLKLAFSVQKDADVARILGLSSSGLANLKKRGSIPWERIMEAAKSQNVSIDWLLTGTGPMYRTQQPPPPLDPRHQKLLELFDALEEDQQREILSVAEEKKRLLELEREVERIRQALGGSGHEG